MAGIASGVVGATDFFTGATGREEADVADGKKRELFERYAGNPSLTAAD